MKRLILFAALMGLLIGTCFVQRESHASTPGTSVRAMGPDARTTTMGPTAGAVTPHAGVKATSNAKTVNRNAATAADAKTVNLAVPNAKTIRPDANKVPADAGVSNTPDARQK